ncbi:MAG: PAS domain-containing sensor histidine kinase [bacterium]|nr:PAS domain-containing sensor histidine kinase [bacterium]
MNKQSFYTNKDMNNKAAKELQKNGAKKALEKRITNLTADVKYTQDILDTVREPFLVLDSALHIVTANPAFYRMFKVLKKNTEGTLVYELGDRQWDIPRLRKLLEEVLPKKKVFNDFEVSHDFPNIGQKTMLLNARRIDHAQLLLLAIEDISDQKQLEELKVKNDKRFRALIEKSADAIALVNRSGKVLYASPSTKRVIGYTPAEFQKLNNPFDLVPPDDRKIVTKVFAELLKEPGSDRHVVYRIKHKNGKHIWIESVMTNMIDDPNLGAVVINYRDMTQRKELEVQKDEFIGIASHELKTPITTMKGYTQILVKRLEQSKDEKNKYLINNVHIQIDRLTSLIEDLLNVNRIEAGKLVFNKKNFDLNKLIKKIVVDFQYTTETHQIAREGVIKEEVYADQSRVEQVLSNLIANAIKYSPKGDKVIVRVDSYKKNIIVSVKDFGFGIDRHDQVRIFDRFYRTKDKEEMNVSGFGLGLYISAEIIKRHRGRIWVESTKGKGSTFYFTLPIKEIKKG